MDNMKGKDIKMKKKLLLLLVAFVLPFGVFAKTYYDDYNTKNFVDTLKEEEIELLNKDYKITI